MNGLSEFAMDAVGIEPIVNTEQFSFLSKSVRLVQVHSGKN